MAAAAQCRRIRATRTKKALISSESDAADGGESGGNASMVSRMTRKPAVVRAHNPKMRLPVRDLDEDDDDDEGEDEGADEQPAAHTRRNGHGNGSARGSMLRAVHDDVADGMD